MGEDRLDQKLPEPGIALLGDDEDVGEIGERRRVADGTGKADLRPVAIEAETQRVGDRALQHIERNAARPV
jgi:hypothetical protein